MATNDDHDNHKHTTFRRPSKGRELALGTLPSAILPLSIEPSRTNKSGQGSHNLVPTSHRRRSSLSTSSSGGEGPSGHASLPSVASKGPSKRIKGFVVPAAAQPVPRSGESSRRASRSSSQSHSHRDHREPSVSSGGEVSNASGTGRSGHQRQTSRLHELVHNGTAKTADLPIDDNGGEGGSSLKTSLPSGLPGNIDNAKTDSAGTAPKAGGHQSVMARVKYPGMLHARRPRRKSITVGSTSATPDGHATGAKPPSNAKKTLGTQREQGGIPEKSEGGGRGPQRFHEMDRISGTSVPHG